jgi:hypothetical protein
MLKYRLTWFLMPYPAITLIWVFSSWFIQGSVFTTETERAMFVMCFLMFGTMFGWIDSSADIGLYGKYKSSLEETENKQRSLLKDAEKLIGEYENNPR